MKILLVENRHKTYFFDAIAKALLEDGHEIFWVVQNHLFIPDSGKVNIIPYPKKRELVPVSKKNNEKYQKLKEIISSDRQLNHFHLRSEEHFFYYDQKILALLKGTQPDFVFGESTAFHELIVIENCKLLGIPYLNPSTCRYPTNRFSFYKYDTLEPFMGSNEELKNQAAVSIIEKIVNRTTQPDYMVKTKKPIKNTWLDKFKILSGYYLGDKYNTPSPLIKYKIETKKNRVIKRWDKIAVGKVENHDQFKILYPLQLQPEANIDVWGRPFRNQLQVVKSILDNTDDDCVIYIKPNPKSKYEISEEFISLIQKEKRLIPLQHQVKMDKVFSDMDLVVTVTGTIAIECILANKPVVTLIKTLNNQNSNCMYLDNFSKLKYVVDTVKSKKFPKLSTDQKASFLSYLNKTSYPGIVSDPISDIQSISENNIQNLVRAFKDVLESSKAK